MKTLFDFLKGNKRFYFFCICFACLTSLLDLVNPKLIEITVDGKVGWGMGAVLVVIFTLLDFAARYLFKLFDALGSEGFVKRSRDRLYGHIIRLPFSWHSANRTGDLIQRCTSDVEELRVFLSEHLANLIRVITMIVLALVFMFRIDLKLTLISGAFFPVIILYSYIFHYRIAKSFLQVDEMEGVVSSIVQENLTGVRVVRAFGREIYEKERFEKKNEEFCGRWVHLMRLLSQFWMTGDLISGLQVLVVVVLGAALVIRGGISTGQYIAFVSYNALLIWPVRMLGRVIAELGKAGISLRRVDYIMGAEAEQDPKEHAEFPVGGDICFEDVSFRYEDGEDHALHHVSMTIPAGKTVGILGSTGSGKSTLMYLLDRLYDLKSGGGRITIGGVDISTMDRKTVRSGIGMVLQEPYLFSGTLKENITLTEREASERRVEKVSKAAALQETVQKFSQGYDTTVGERGVTLSGGQKQRVAIAQMLLRKTPVMIFDDSLSAVDADTDRKIREALKTHTKDATVILIAHRIATIRNADIIYVMDRGRVAEYGTHESLMAQQGLYRRIFELQKPEGGGL